MATNKLVDGEIVPMTPAEEAAFLAARPAIGQVYTLTKTTVIDRLTDTQLATFETALTNANRRTRMLFQNIDALRSDSALFGQVQTLLTTAFGATEATRILAR